MKVFVQREYSDAILPERAHSTDAGWDIYAYKDTLVEAGGRNVVDIGIRIIVEAGYYYTFAPRSSLAFQENLIVSHHNVMDAGYSGQCGVLMWNRGSADYKIVKGSRFCQVIFHKVPEVDMHVVKRLYDLPKLSRSKGGFGSSGR